MDLTSQIIGVESGGNPSARNPRSSAGGLGQFIDATWLDTISRHRPDLVAGKSREQILALKMDPDLSRDMTKAYAGDNSAFLSQSGFDVTPGNTYLAHFAGPQGAAKVLGSAPDAPVGAVLGPAVVKANPFLANMTVADLRAWADKKMGGAQAQPQRASPQAAPQGLLAQHGPGLLGALPWQAPMAAAGTGQSMMGAAPQQQSMPLMQLPPPPEIRRRPVDLAGLQPLLNRPRFGGFSFG